MRPGSLAGFRLRAFVGTFAVALGLTGCLATAGAHAATKLPYSVAVAPSTAVAGSTGNTLVFTLTALNVANGNVAVTVPTGAGWTAPQNRFPAQAGFVSTAPGTCKKATLTAVGGARTPTVDTQCKKGQSFRLTYAGAKAPTVAGPYTFVTRATVGSQGVALSPQPVVTVNPGPTSRLAVTGLANAVAGTAQHPTVTAQDAFGNTTPAYRGIVHFTGSGDDPAFSFGDSGWVVPGNYTFTAGDAGSHAFAATAKTAGAQTLTATDTGTSMITGSQTITISPGPTALLAATFSSLPDSSAIPGQTVRVGIVVTAGDSHANVATGDNTSVSVKVEKQGSDSCAGCFDLLLGTLQNGRKSFNINVAVVSSPLQVSAFPVERAGEQSFGSIFQILLAPPKLDTVKLNWDPTTPNGDGTYNGNLELTDPDTHTTQAADPNSLVVSGEPVADPSTGLTSIPVTIDLVGGGTIDTIIKVTTPTDPATGEFVPADYSNGQQLQVVGCDGVKGTFGSLDSATLPPDLPPPPDCSGWNPVTVDKNTAYVLTNNITGRDVAALFDVCHNIQAGQCVDSPL